MCALYKCTIIIIIIIIIDLGSDNSLVWNFCGRSTDVSGGVANYRLFSQVPGKGDPFNIYKAI